MIEDLFKINGLQEKPKVEEAKSNMSIVGKYIVTPDLFNTLIYTQKPETKELRLADAMINYLQEKPIHGHLLQGIRFDTGDKLGFLSAVLHYGLKHPELKEGFLEEIKKVI